MAQQETSAELGSREYLEFATPVLDGLLQVEKILNEVVSRDVRAVRNIYFEVLRGGKRLRPTLVLLCTSVFRPLASCDKGIYRSAAAVELVHLASLLHDDLVDRSPLRRGQPSVQRHFGVEAAVLTGDYMAAAGYRRLSLHGRPRALSRLANAVAGMCEAELVVLGEQGDPLDQRAYLAVAAGKTGSLLAAACEIGAIEGEADLMSTQILGAYGRDLGIAFQIADDLLDLYGDPDKTGKPRGQDVLCGQPNLPVILALETDSDGKLRRMLENLRESEEPTEKAVVAVADAVEELGGHRRARDVAERYAMIAAERLTHVPAGEACDALAQGCRYVVDRTV